MSKIAVVYWSGTGNTEAMAAAVAEGVQAAGAVAELFTAAEFSPEQLQGFGELPSKDALVAQVLGTFLAPISSLAFVLDQIRAQKEGPAAEAAAE